MGDPPNPSIGDGAGVRTDCCYVCGSTSCGQLLVACKMCKCCIHVYCYISFYTNPLDRVDPDDWVCEHCQPPNFTSSSKPAASKFAVGSVKMKRPVKRISEDEVVALRAGSLASEGKGPPIPPEEPCKKVARSERRQGDVKTRVLHKTSRQKCGLRVSNQEKVSCSPHANSPPAIPVMPSSPENNMEDNVRSPSSIYNPSEPAPGVPTSSPVPVSPSGQNHNIEKHVHAEVPFPLSKPSPEPQSCKEHSISRTCVAKGDDIRTNQPKTSTNFEEQSLEDAQVRIDRCLPNPPSRYATWKGSLKITASGFGASVDSYDKIWGYPPTKTTVKALEFSKQLPNFLHFDAVPRDIIWADMFIEEGPDKEDIGLYFFPVDVRSGQCYCCLVSLLEKLDVVIRCHINGVQLLVFTSRHLDNKSQKINGAYYLWGLFVPPGVAFKEPRQITNQLAVEKEQNEDMEIDMVGEELAGRTDIPISRDSRSGSSSKVQGKKALEEKEDGISTALRKAESLQTPSVQVKVEKCDGNDLSSPPGFASRPEQTVPPGFAGVNPRVKYKPIGELLQTNPN